MPPRTGQRPRPPLTAVKLDELALYYVGRFATSRGKLIVYLERKLRERGWAGDHPPDPVAIADRLAQLGYIDDAAFALSKARSLIGRGFGERRLGQALHAAKISEEDAGAARDLAGTERVEAALRMARRRRLGPFAATPMEPVQLERGIAAMIRGGHGFALSRGIVCLPPGADYDVEELSELR